MTFQNHARSSTKWMLAALSAFCLLATTAPGTAAARPQHSISIAAARALPLGSRVTVEGNRQHTVGCVRL